MEKIKLDPDALTVVTFDPTEADGGAQAHSFSTPFIVSTGGPGFCNADCIV